MLTITPEEALRIGRRSLHAHALVAAVRPHVVHVAEESGHAVDRNAGLVLTEGRVLADVTIPLSRGGAITGVVRDDRGAPMPNVPVDLFRRGILTTRRVWTWVRKTFVTDARGVYQAEGAPPGEYIVAVSVMATTYPASVVEAVRAVPATEATTSPLMRSMQDSRAPMPPAGFAVTGPFPTSITAGLAPQPIPVAVAGADGKPACIERPSPRRRPR